MLYHLEHSRIFLKLFNFKFPWVGFCPFVLLTPFAFYLHFSFPFCLCLSFDALHRCIEWGRSFTTHTHRQKCIFCVLEYEHALFIAHWLRIAKLWPNPYLGILTFYMVKICLNSNLINFLENSSLEFPWNTIFYLVGKFGLDEMMNRVMRFVHLQKQSVHFVHFVPLLCQNLSLL